MKRKNGVHLYSVGPGGDPVTEFTALAQERAEFTGADLAWAWSETAKEHRALWTKHQAWEKAVLPGGSRKHVAGDRELELAYEVYTAGRDVEQFVTDVATATGTTPAEARNAMDVVNHTTPAEKRMRAALEKARPKLTTAEAAHVESAGSTPHDEYVKLVDGLRDQIVERYPDLNTDQAYKLANEFAAKRRPGLAAKEKARVAELVRDMHRKKGT